MEPKDNRTKTDKLQRKLLLSQCATIICILLLLTTWPKGTEWLFWVVAGLLVISIGVQLFYMIKVLKARRK